MKFDPHKHHRRSIRLKGYDYTQPGAYFVTVVTYQREDLFGDFIEGEMRLNWTGKQVKRDWERLARRFPNIESIGVGARREIVKVMINNSLAVPQRQQIVKTLT